MKNYISIDGKKIEISQETADNIAKEFVSEGGFFDLDKLSEDFSLFTEEQAHGAGFSDEDFMFVMNLGPYAGKAFILDPEYNWELTDDADEYKLLIPTRKTENCS